MEEDTGADMEEDTMDKSRTVVPGTAATERSLSKACNLQYVQTITQYPLDYLKNEAYSLLARLDQVKPFSMTMPMVKGASVSEQALSAIMNLLENGKHNLRKNIFRLIGNLNHSRQEDEQIRELQSAFTILKLRFNSILDQLDIFSDVLTQRAEHEVGVWLSGLDVLADDGLTAARQFFESPALMVYLDRGHGAAIRRARTRLPGGEENPVGVIQIPRERMVGSGIASSLIHEVGHQVAALLNLVPTLKSILVKKKLRNRNPEAWACFERWISEMVCDVWAVGILGVAATMGLMGVVTLPKYFQFRISLTDPHPAPYVRVFLSCAFGKKIYPNAQWDKLWDLWNTFYPRMGLNPKTETILAQIESEAPEFIDLVLQHTTAEMKGKRLVDLFPVEERNPDNLRKIYQSWKAKKISLQALPPTLVFALLGQAKYNLVIDASEESQVLTKLLHHWAFNRN